MQPIINIWFAHIIASQTYMQKYPEWQKKSVTRNFNYIFTPSPSQLVFQ